MRITHYGSFYDYLIKHTSALSREIESERENELLNGDEESYIEYWTQKFSLENVNLLLDKMTMNLYDKVIPVTELPDFQRMMMGYEKATEKHKQNTIRCYIPFTGDRELLSFEPSRSIALKTRLDLLNDEISFEIVDLNYAEDRLKNEVQVNKDRIQQNIQFLNDDINLYNRELKQKVATLVMKRKEKILNRVKLAKNIGIPLRHNSDYPEALKPPIVKKSISICKPASSNTPFKPEPALNDALYQDILVICDYLGRQMERLPSIYKNDKGLVKSEEPLRDLFILTLAPHFQNTVSGETFNRRGKTDIYIPYEGGTVFIAELKFWHGPKGHQETINQLLSYLTWRDSKAAIICFVKNQELQPVFEKIKSETPKHPCFVEDLGSKSEAWFNYRFHLPEDKTRTIKLAILVFCFN